MSLGWLNLTEHLWGELEVRLRGRPSYLKSVTDLTNAILDGMNGQTFSLKHS